MKSHVKSMHDIRGICDNVTFHVQ